MHQDGGAGIPDAWARLWAPHRMDYLKGENRPLDGNNVACPFCSIPALSDEDGLIVHRGKEAYVQSLSSPTDFSGLRVESSR